MPRALRPSEMQEESSNPNPKGIVKSEFRKEYVFSRLRLAQSLAAYQK